MTALEAHYKRLLQLYPAAYRQQRGDEILATLVESADPERERPTFGDTVDLVGHALRLRLAIGEQQPIGRLFVVVGPSQLVMASLMSMIAIYFGEWRPFAAWPWVSPGHMGPFFTAGPIVYFAWILAGLSLLIDRPRFTRALVGLSMALTAVLVPFGHLFSLGRPSMFFLLFLVALGLPYVAVPHQGSVWSASQPWQKALLVLPFLPAAFIVLGVARSGSTGLDPGTYFYRVALNGVVPWIAWSVTGAVVLSVFSLAVSRRLAGATVALLALPWLVLWFGNHFAAYVSARTAMGGFVLTGLLLLILAKFATTVRSNVLEEAGAS
ncbi:MAG TPA: hypothetical protein VG298_04990 [Acidimicrobiales bacterium]|jgi:hypothetical protein|nr:hypothetical protein [Acidimicrobiales bacterium]